MRVVYDEQVRDFLYEYDKILKKKISYSNKYARTHFRFLVFCWLGNIILNEYLQ